MSIGVVVIGRNEGQRLQRCLESLAGFPGRIVYVDSNSADGSADLATSRGAEVVELDGSIPLCAAMARNAGFERLRQIAPEVEFVQFVDGDCQVVPDWIERAQQTLAENPQAGVVCGRRREMYPQHSVYNRLADLEWNTPIGEVKSCGGDAMMRAAAFAKVGGFDSSVAAGEEPELCQRLRAGGWKVLRIDAEMTLHDSAMLRLGQWWRRAVRSGYGAMDVAWRFGSEGLFVRQVRSARIWAVGWPIMILLAGVTTGVAAGPIFGCIAAAIVLLIGPLQVLRLALQVSHRTASFADALAYGLLTMLGKWAAVVGQVRYWGDRRAGRNTRLIEYKQQRQPAPQPANP